MPVLYAHSVEKELFLERFDERVEVPEIGSSFIYTKYDFYMMLNEEDRVDRDNPLFRDVIFDDYIYARSSVLLREKRVSVNEDGLKTAGFVVVSFLGKLGTNISFDDQSMVISASPQPQFTVETNGEIFRGPFSMAFLHANPHIS